RAAAISTAAAAAANSTTTATAAAVAATTAAAAAFLRFGFVHFEFTPVNLFPVKLRDSVFCFFLRSHFDKTKSARAARFAIFDDIGRFDRADRTKQIVEILIRCVEGNISYIKFH